MKRIILVVVLSTIASFFVSCEDLCQVNTYEKVNGVWVERVVTVDCDENIPNNPCIVDESGRIIGGDCKPNNKQ